MDKGLLSRIADRNNKIPQYSERQNKKDAAFIEILGKFGQKRFELKQALKLASLGVTQEAIDKVSSNLLPIMRTTEESEKKLKTEATLISMVLKQLSSAKSVAGGIVANEKTKLAINQRFSINYDDLPKIKDSITTNLNSINVLIALQKNNEEGFKGKHEDLTDDHKKGLVKMLVEAIKSGNKDAVNAIKNTGITHEKLPTEAQRPLNKFFIEALKTQNEDHLSLLEGLVDYSAVTVMDQKKQMDRLFDKTDKSVDDLARLARFGITAGAIQGEELSLGVDLEPIENELFHKKGKEEGRISEGSINEVFPSVRSSGAKSIKSIEPATKDWHYSEFQEQNTQKAERRPSFVEQVTTRAGAANNKQAEH